MATALIGHTGFVGGTLLRQTKFDRLYNSKNIQEIENEEFDTVICAGASAKKWLANSDPFTDRVSIDRLIGHLSKVHARNFILISTVDVFKRPVAVDESTPVDEEDLHPYGLHRRILERFVQGKFSNHLVVRLPGLVGPGLTKNAIYDLKHGNNVEKINGKSVFQFYPMVNLKQDLDTAWQENLSLVHLTSEPISMDEVARECFDRDLTPQAQAPVEYNFRSIHAGKFGAGYGYMYNKREVLLAIRAYAQGEG